MPKEPKKTVLKPAETAPGSGFALNVPKFMKDPLFHLSYREDKYGVTWPINQPGVDWPDDQITNGVDKTKTDPVVERSRTRLVLGYELADGFLHVTFGKRKQLPLPFSEQYSHVLHYLLEQCDIKGQNSVGVTHAEVWNYLIDMAKNGEITDQPEPDKDRRSIKKSIDRHITTLKKKLKEAFPSLKEKAIFKNKPGGFFFNR